jgi:hypothetical protein
LIDREEGKAEEEEEKSALINRSSLKELNPAHENDSASFSRDLNEKSSFIGKPIS